MELSMKLILLDYLCMYETLDEHYATGLSSLTPKQWFAKLTEDDEPEIKDQIQQWIEDIGELPPKTLDVYLYCEQADKEFTLEINPYDYVTESQMEEILAQLEEF